MGKRNPKHKLTALGLALAAGLSLGACSIWAVDNDAPAAAPPPPVTHLPAPTAGLEPGPAPGVNLNEQPSQPAAAEQPVTEAPADPNRVVVRGVFERQVPVPEGDPRSTSQRMEDIRAWDTCVMRAQNAAESDPLRPDLDMPEDICRQRLGMSSRQGIPDSRRDR